ncbi:nucleoporin [Martiniozyma asiatica (nom. inval.)]|nr:nucleoporin [Martiniozyma asiatica]
MAKRVKNQLTKDGTLLREDDTSDEEMDTPQIASQEKMARRPIARLGKRFGKTTTTAPAGSDNSEISTTKATQLKSLNANFLKSVNDAITKNPVADLNSVVNKYIEYYSKVMGSKILVKQLHMPEVIVDEKVIDDTDSKVKVNPFSMFKNFSTTPTAATTQEEKKSEKQDPIEIDSDSEEEEEEKEVKIQGPSFKIDTLPKSKDYGFKFGYVPPKDSDSEDEVEIKGPTFNTDVKVVDSVFKFPKKDNSTIKSEAPTPACSFGGAKKDETAAPTPAFSFGGAKKDETAAPTPAFSFGGAKKEETAAPTPAFSFGGAKKEETAAPTPAFSFGGAKKEETAAPTPAFSFGGAKKEETAAPTPAFSFGGAKKEETAAPTPAFSFGGAKKEETAAPTPAFSFGGDKKSTFSFGSNPSESAATSFTFNSDNNKLSESSNPFSIGGTTTLTFAAPTGGFTFNTPKPQAESADNSNNFEINSESKENEKDEVKGNFAVVNLTEKIDVKTGEEDEIVLYTKRSKISKLKADKSSYDAVGLGELKVMKNSSSGKSRLLARSEGGLNVILNVAISDKVKYEITGKKNNMIKIPVFTSDGIETYLAMVKTGEDAKELLKNIESCQ